jgi:hypothetical protein
MVTTPLPQYPVPAGQNRGRPLAQIRQRGASAQERLLDDIGRVELAA